MGEPDAGRQTGGNRDIDPREEKREGDYIIFFDADGNGVARFPADEVAVIIPESRLIREGKAETKEPGD